MPTVADLAAEHFRPYLHQTFSIELAAGVVVSAELVEVYENPRRHPAVPRQPFALTFQTTLPPKPGQGTYGLIHPELGRFDLFMAAVQPTPTGQRYEIVFA